MLFTSVVGYDNIAGAYALNRAAFICQDNHARIMSGLIFHTCPYNRGLRL